METELSTLPSVSLRETPRAEDSSRASDRSDEETRVRKDRPVPPRRKDVQAAADRLNQALETLSRDLAISVHEDSGKLIVEVTDPGTGEVVRQIPAEQVLEAQESIDKIVGLFVNDIA
jgi:flagellar protein FlaG